MSHEPYISVRDVMTPNPIVVDGLATVRQAADLMRDRKISSIVIDRRDESDVYGIVAIKDIAEQIVSQDRSPDRVSVYEIMSKPVLTLDAGMNIKYAVRLLFRFKLNRALVLDNGKAAGIVTLRDLTLRSLEQSGSAS